MYEGCVSVSGCKVGFQRLRLEEANGRDFTDGNDTK